MKKAILIDFDGTITTDDTCKYLLFAIIQQRPSRALVSLFNFIKIYFLKDEYEKQSAKNKAIGNAISGLSELKSKKALKKFKLMVSKIIRKTMLQKIKDSNINGIKVIIVTASPTFAISDCLSEMEAAVIGTDFKTTNSIYNGQVDGDFCYGKYKIKKINDWLEDKSIEYDFIEAWSDNISDYPMMKMARKRFWIGNKKLKNKLNTLDPCGYYISDHD